VSQQQDLLAEDRRDKAVNLISETVVRLETLKFSHREIGTLVQIVLMERARRLENLHIAAIDCNPEALSIFERQLRGTLPVKMSKFLLDDLHGKAGPEAAFREFDLILVTAAHHSEVLGALPSLRDRIVKVAVSVNQQTVIDLARIPTSSRLGILCRSEQFLRIIRAQLKSFQIPVGQIKQAFEDDQPDLASFVSDLEILIVPPECPILRKRDNSAAIGHFRNRGGRLIEFDHQIDRGTIIHVGERISRLLEMR
jgi:hypothetical protein